MEYFKDIAKHRQDLVWEDERDGDAIELVFCRNKVEERKDWVLQLEVGTAMHS